MTPATGSIVSLALTLSTSLAVLEDEDPPCGGFRCEHEGGGAEIGLTQKETQDKATEWPPGSSEESPDSWYEYVAVIDCRPPNTPDQPRLEICGFAVTFCEEYVPESFGPRSWIYRRTVDDSGPTSDWQELAPTCFTDSVPARSGEPAEELTEAMIVEQFHRTAFALPQTVIQPPDGRTLVNLPVYFELEWPEEGYAPQDIDTTTIVGHEVRIRPTLIGATYVTGDGGSIGPTTSLGGPYPDGDITHDYTAAADIAPYISVEYGGEVSVDGGSWTTIPSSAVIDGPSSPLQVLTSRNRLYTN
ncbi:hypothetical protein [Serinicoccus sp. LYQ131]|uniref:hypothetical protein n=1 Tax=Serinicoccus sp. LYQ131 TaxID=3378797 RepID=UPI0038529C0E